MTETFQAFAVELLHQHTESLKKIYQSNPIAAGKLKLKAFNEHLDELKQGMLNQIKILLSEARDQGSDVDALSISLMKTYNTIINDFFTRDFNAA